VIAPSAFFALGASSTLVAAGCLYSMSRFLRSSDRQAANEG